jgi:hypothetical protein
LFSLYFGLNRLGLIPAIYSDEYPQAYYELIDEAETSKEKPISGEYKYQLFLKQYDRFVNENSGNTQSY